ncbi:hypothetical protein HNP84_007351 [Thermocatellispora tengchongensis]|uniref:Uncharacterized protein n=1 Tax=Thermocatellispora tengchongensis TaxID=1073253 RepID=A0A840PF40_9ACTN|nr:hypothetical protein [Thermocatellispora tengchongensis]MBB5137599.1 hypothetical protein [Thermocatellispora tengchongensis]
MTRPGRRGRHAIPPALRRRRIRVLYARARLTVTRYWRRAGEPVWRPDAWI